MKRIIILLFTLFSVYFVFAQNISETGTLDYQRPNINAENQLNRMIIETLEDCFNNDIYKFKYLNTKGIPYDFPYDSLNLIPYYHDRKNSEEVEKEMKKKEGIEVINVHYEFLDDCFVVFVGESTISMPKRRHVSVAVGTGGRCSVFKFSCEKQQWQRVESLWNNDLPKLDKHTGLSVYRYVEQMPEYKNGDKDFWNDFYSNFPINTKGDKTYQINTKVKYVININGQLVGARILDNNYDEKPIDKLSDLEKAILSTLDHLQGWNPGIHNGKKVNILIYRGILISFTNNNEINNN